MGDDNKRKDYKEYPIMSEVLKSLESLYTQERYTEALELLEKSQDALPLGQFHYNLGTLYLKMNQVGPARYHLETALNEGFVHSALFNNLSYLQQQLNLVDLSRSSSILDRLYNFSLSTPQEIYLLIFLLLILSGCVFFKFFRLRRWAFSLPFFLGATLTAYMYLGVVRTSRVAVALNDAEVLEGPSKLYTQKFQLPAGAKIILGKEADDWFYIERPLHFSGWVKMSDLGFIGEQK